MQHDTKMIRLQYSRTRETFIIPRDIKTHEILYSYIVTNITAQNKPT